MVTIYIDWISFLFIRFVCLISSMVIYYRDGYMEDELNKDRFCFLVFLFVISIVVIIISPNLISILLGWDGLGLVSYCLVIYYQNVKSFNAGILTVLTNRLGDVALLICIAWMINFGRWNYLNYTEMNCKEIQIIGILVIFAAWTKRAQIPFRSWLPAAMAAPTPVSSLVHSRTLVTAGVYLLIRFNLVFTFEIKHFMLFLALLTIFISGLRANFEFDLKKIIALSTLRQLGLIIRILFIGEEKLAFFHLLAHAIFKALLFMCAGNYIHRVSCFQDIRFMGNLTLIIPLTRRIFNIRNLSLCGLPFLSGFYSKDLILEFMSINYLNLFVYLIFYISIGLTVIYRIRLMFYSLLGDYNFLVLNSLKEDNESIIIGMLGLVFFVIFRGRIIIWTLFPRPYFICLSLEMKMITLIIIIIGGCLGFLVYQFKISYDLNSYKFYKFRLFNSLMWNLIYLSTLSLNFIPIYRGNFLIKTVDLGWLEEYGPKKLGVLSKIRIFFQILLNNYIKIFFFLILFWIFFIFIVYLNSLR